MRDEASFRAELIRLAARVLVVGMVVTASRAAMDGGRAFGLWGVVDPSPSSLVFSTSRPRRPRAFDVWLLVGITTGRDAVGAGTVNILVGIVGRVLDVFVPTSFLVFSDDIMSVFSFWIEDEFVRPAEP